MKSILNRIYLLEDTNLVKMNIRKIIREEIDEWHFNRIKLNTRLIISHSGVIVKIVGFNPKYNTLEICSDFGCSKISIQNLKALIKDGTYKILD